MSLEKKSNHQANVVRITEIVPHPDPETTSLELIPIGGYQVVAKKGQFLLGDLAVYIQPDSVVPQTEPFRFIWQDYVGLDGIAPEKRRRITVRKFRGEWSEGLLLPLSDFRSTDLLVDPNGKTRSFYPAEGEDVSGLLSITHYDPDAGKEDTKAPQAGAPKRKFKYPKTFRGWLGLALSFIKNRGSVRAVTRDVPFVLPTYDVEAFKNYKGTFEPGESVVVTEKIHGSNARFMYLDGEMYAGSRTQWKQKGGTDVWSKALKQNPWIENWCIQNPGYALYGEVTPTQGDKWKYGSNLVQFFVFDIRTPDGTWMDFASYPANDAELVIDHSVPLLYLGPYDHDFIQSLVDGPSSVPDASNIREGIVVKTAKERHVRGLGRAQLKIVSNAFLAKDSK